MATATYLDTLAKSLSLSGKIRISAAEGINITVAGASESIVSFINELTKSDLLIDLCMQERSFNNKEEELEWNTKRFNFFKPSPGCIHGNLLNYITPD